MHALDDLKSTLSRIDGRGYKAYKDIRGAYATRSMELTIDHVQGDPFAAPSRLRAFVPHGVAGYDPWLYENAARRVALADWIARRFARGCRGLERRGSGKSGEVRIDAPGQQVLPRTACLVGDDGIELRFTVGLPAAGRKVLGRQATSLLCAALPELVDGATRAPEDDAEVRAHVCSVEDQRALRGQLREAGLVAFVADGAILPRRSGVEPRPMDRGEATPFRSPPERAVTLEAPHAGAIDGMGIPDGVTLIVGGGYHGKSTLLSAIELGIYDHRPGDGRERCVSDPAAVKIRAEDGRRVERVDIGVFIDNLPGGRDTRSFTSEDASGSTSQAANVVEALEAGARALLVDEDTAATNFMIRDRRMQQLVAKDKEPITPFVDRVRELHRGQGVSTVLVIGGSGDYFDVADTVIAMEDYLPHDVTEQARNIASEPTGRVAEAGESIELPRGRAPRRGCIDARKGRGGAKIRAREGAIELGENRIDVSAVGQLVCTGQLRAIGQALHHLSREQVDGRRTVSELLDRLEEAIEDAGLDAIDDRAVGDHAWFRRFELAAALNRLRSLRVS